VAELFTAENLFALLTLTSLEVVLGIDNIVFIAILCARLPPERRESARRIGLFLAMFARIALLLMMGWLAGLTSPLVPAIEIGQFSHAFSGRDLILALGGLFLVGKATLEIHHKLEGPAGDDRHAVKPKHADFGGILTQIVLLDLVFSLDSVITAVGMARSRYVMVTVVILAVVVMMVFSGRIADYIERRPTIKILALSFLLLIGVTLVVEGCSGHVSKGYIYFAMAFSLGVEMLNLRMRKHEPVLLRDSHLPRDEESPHASS
jgi:predicted tellurium resistance membrane protein TerC